MSDGADLIVRPLGDTALLVSPHRQDDRWAAAARRQLLASRPAPVTDLAPAFSTLGVYFDAEFDASDESPPYEQVARWVRSCIDANPAAGGARQRRVELPVCYDDDLGPDLAQVADHTGRSVERVIERHAAAEYAVGAIGFQPGFPYLMGLPAELRTPRLPSPRTRVPAGAVGIGGRYTGVYPAESPGGWNLLGQTPLRLFDPSRSPPSLLDVGDRVRFVRIERSEFDRLRREHEPVTPAPAAPIGEPRFRVVRPGMADRLVAPPRLGEQHLGVSPGGPMDGVSCRIANQLAGATPGARVLEASLTGPLLECTDDCVVGVAGAVPREYGHARRLVLRAGERIDLRPLVRGCRAYLAASAGFSQLAENTLFTTSRSHGPDRRSPGRSLNHPARPPTGAAGEFDLRIIVGPHADRFDDASIDAFRSSSFRVGPQSDRTGLRLTGPPLCSRATDEMPSQPVVTGAIQVPPGGEPIILGADRYTLGGYPIIGAVISADWPTLGQLRPGDAVRFRVVDLSEAATARRRLQSEIDRLVTSVKLRGDGV